MLTRLTQNFFVILNFLGQEDAGWTRAAAQGADDKEVSRLLSGNFIILSWKKRNVDVGLLGCNAV
jgi:hypothetical protein